jgi:hypothetical protein
MILVTLHNVADSRPLFDHSPALLGDLFLPDSWEFKPVDVMVDGYCWVVDVVLGVPADWRSRVVHQAVLRDGFYLFYKLIAPGNRSYANSNRTVEACACLPL